MEHVKIIGGPERKAYNKKGVIPMNFSEEDPFYDISARLNTLDRKCKSGEIQDLIILVSYGETMTTYWRGNSRRTTALGMLEFAKELL